MPDGEHTFVVNLRDLTDGLCWVRRFTAGSLDDALAKAERYCRTQAISPDDTEVWSVADEDGNDLWTAY